MNNLELYEKVRAVPDNAKKPINAGRLKGMTDINPMWRIKALTEQFGICGLGWKTEIVRTWLDCGANGEISANVEIKLYVKVGYDCDWSDAICGIGGSKFVSKESSGLYTDDECYKKAYTDALSVACKALGIGADVYWNKDSTKYDQSGPTGDNKGSPLTAPTLQQLAELNKYRRTLAHVAKDCGVDEKAVTSEHVASYLEKVKAYKAKQAAEKNEQWTEATAQQTQLDMEQM